MKRVFLLGPFDRYNYGDLIFPNVVAKMLEKYEVEIHYLAYKSLDLTSIGGVRTTNINQIYKDGFLNDEDAIIIVGGDTLAVNYRLVNNQLSDKNYMLSRIESKIKGEKGLMKKFGVKSNYPWIVDPTQFDKKIYVAYNAVGGVLDNMGPDKLDLLKNASYLSMRDTLDVDLGDLNFHNSPDCAFIISDLYPKSYLNSISSFNYDYDYLVFQIQYNSFVKNKGKIIEQLNKIAKVTKVKLLVIGYASGHDDQKAYNEIIESVETPSQFEIVLNTTIFDIMNVIANAKFVIASSLHGNITAETYEVAHFGIDPDIKKLKKYLKTYELNENIFELHEFGDKYLADEYNVELEILNGLKQKIYENFEKMFKGINL